MVTDHCPVLVSSEDFCDVKPDDLVNKEDKRSQYRNTASLYDAENACLTTKIVKSNYPSTVSLWTVESGSASQITFGRTLFATYVLFS